MPEPLGADGGANACHTQSAKLSLRVCASLFSPGALARRRGGRAARKVGSCLPAGLPRAQRRRNLLRDGARPWRVLRVTVGEGAGSTPVSRG